MRRVLVASGLALVLGLLAPLVLPAPASASTSAPSSFVERINAVRTAKGLAPLLVDEALTAVAQSWTDHLAAAGRISHNSRLAEQVAGAWLALGENVGAGTDVPALMQAFIDSPTHYANLVDPDYGYVGVAVQVGPDGRLYTTHLFMAMGSRPAVGAVPPPAAASAPAPIAPARVAVVLAELRGVEV